MVFDINRAVIDQKLEESQALAQKLAATNPAAQEELLGFFSKADPEVFLGKKLGNLTIVSDEKRKQVEKIIGSPIVRLRETQNHTLLLDTPKICLKTSQKNPDTQKFSEAELEVYSSLYFKNSEARKFFVALFFQEKNYQQYNLSLNLLDSYESEETTEIASNLYSFSDKTLKEREKGRNNKLLRFIKNFLGSMGISGGEVIDFPDIFKQSPELPQESTEVLETKKYKHDIEEILQKVLISSLIELAKLPENIEWFMGIRKYPYLQQNTLQQFHKIRDIEIILGLHNYHDHIESVLALLVAYYNPWIVEKYAAQKGKNMSQQSFEKYPNPQNMFSSVSKNKNNTSEVETGTLYEMNAKVAEHYGYPEGIRIRLTTELSQNILSLADEAPVIFRFQGKPIEISAKMFKRVFHRNTLPTKEETNTIISFPT